MKKIIFSKYSNERSDLFKIRTDILADNQGKKIVQKRPLTLQAQQHIDNIYKNYELLSDLYDNENISINKCKKINGSGIEFEYLNGKTLAEKLEELACKEKYIEIVELIKNYVDIISCATEEKFIISEDFEQVFGKVDLPGYLKALNISDIDLIFSNIILGDKWNIIDYEWTFNFPVPLNYTIFRSIKIFIDQSSMKEKLEKLGLYELFGIDEKQINEYMSMEYNFEKYVLKECIPMKKLYGKTIGMNMDIKELIENEKDKIFTNSIQVFFDYGMGFNENDSYKFYKLPKDNKVKFQIEIDNKIKRVRIDPAICENILSIEYLRGYNGKYYDMKFYSNGIAVENELLFIDNDPQIIIENIKSDTVRLEIEYKIQLIPNSSAINLSNYINHKNDYLADKDKELMSAKESLIEKEKELASINKDLSDMKKKVEKLNSIINNYKDRIDQYNNMSILNKIIKKI